MQRPSAALPLAAQHGRVARALRVSVTDRCNLRCTYCMPAEGIDPLPNDRLLTDDEVVRLIRISLEKLGIEEIRFTGGEPLLRKGLEAIVAEASTMKNHLGVKPELSLTTIVDPASASRPLNGIACRSSIRRRSAPL